VAKKISSKKAEQKTRKVVKGPLIKSFRKPITMADLHQQDDNVKRYTKTPMTKSELEEFRKALLEKRRSIVGDMHGIQNEALGHNRQETSGDLSNMPTHPADIGTDNYEQEFTLGLLESERVLLREIDQALERIRTGTFGICLGTGKLIDKARLRARPWAKYCIDYARLMEKGLAKPVEGGSSSAPEGPQDEEHEEEEVEEEEAEEDVDE
jgi:DnaK suppressor protein